MKRAAARTAGFALSTTVISMIGLLSALIDNTLGWEHLAQEILIRLAQ